MNFKKQSLYVLVLTIAAFFAPATQANHMESFQAEWEAKLENAQSAMVAENGLKMSIYDFYKEAQSAQTDLLQMLANWDYRDAADMEAQPNLFVHKGKTLTQKKVNARYHWLTTFMAPYFEEYCAILRALYPAAPTDVFTEDEIIRE